MPQKKSVRESTRGRKAFEKDLPIIRDDFIFQFQEAIIKRAKTQR